MNRQRKQQRVEQSHDAWNIVNNLILTYGTIDTAFVIDLGFSDGTWKIVELNNINSAGLYETNTDALVRAFKNL